MLVACSGPDVSVKLNGPQPAMRQSFLELTRMYPRAFRYYRAKSLQEATALLAELGTDAKVLAGGQSLIPLMKL